MDPTAHEYFGRIAEEYDSLIRRAVPRYEEIFQRLLTYAPATAERVLELGCGTGVLTARLVERYPAATVTAVDASAKMLAVTEARLPAGARFVAHEGRFEDLAFAPGSFDLVTSSIALHHLEDMEPYFRRIVDWLVPGGTFLYADQMRGGTERNHHINWSAMTDFWREPGHLDAEEIRSLEDHARDHDHYRPILDQARWLAAAGFVEVDVVWRNWMWGILSARTVGG